MQIIEADFFSQLLCWQTTDELRELFDHQLFDEQLGFLHFLGVEKIDVSALPTLELPDTVLFPDESLMMSRTGPLLQRVKELDTVVLLEDLPVAIVKFSSRRKEDDVPVEVCTLGTVRATADARLHVLTHARVVSDQSQDERLGRNPVHSVFGFCADFAKARDNFVKLVRQFPGIDGVQGSLMLDQMDEIEWVGRYYDKQSDTNLLNYEGEAPGWEDVQCLDVAADFIAVSLIRQMPDLRVPVRLQRQWLDILNPDERVRALNAFMVEVLNNDMTPERIYTRAVEAKIERYKSTLKFRVDEWSLKDLLKNGTGLLEEKLKEAQEQLDDPVARLRGKLDTCGMSREARTQLGPEIDGLSNRTNRKTMEYFERLADLPWRGGEVEAIDVKCAQRILNEQHFGLPEAKKRVLEYLAVRHRKRDVRGPILCFVGPPGVGKTSLAASIAKALGRKFAGISCNGLRETADVRGASRDFVASQPGQIIRQLQSVGAKNPVFVLDEIDKMSSSAADALLDALDPTQNARFHDLYVGVPFDLSEVFFVATANVLDRIPSPLRDRLEVIDLAGYSEAEKFEIAKRLVPARVEDHGLTSDLIEFEDEALRALISDHANEMGVRDLDRSVSAICRWAALRLETAVDRTPARVTVKEGMLNEVLGTRSGHGEGLPGVERLRAMIERGGMPPETRRQAKRELQLMLSKPPDDHDYGKIFTYLQWLVGLPWSGDEVEAIDVKCAQRVLDERHFGLPEAKKRILEYLAVRRRKRDARGPILCLAGPPGVGKTSLARNIAEAIGRKFGVISCAGLRDGSEVRGHSRTYIGSQPGRIVRELVRIGAKNPVLMLDEIDKIPGGGEAESALLEVLDPTQNDRFIDYYVGVPFDLSEVFFVATANVLDRIPSPLRNRLEVIDLAGYSKAEKFEIAKRLVPARVEDHGLTSDLIEFEDEALRALISDHADEMGVRDLDRSVSAICRWAALRLETAVGRTAAKVTVKEGMLNEVLGTRSGHGEGLLGVERLRAMIERGGMPPETRRQAKRELQLMLSKPPDDHDYGKILTYLQWLVGLPWSGDEVEAIDVKCAQRVLDERHFGLPEAKKRILEYLAVRRRKRDARGPILCLAGPPGVGKTSLARNIAEAIGRKFGVISCAGLRDGSEVRGHSRTYIGSQPGRIVRELVRIGAKNPVLMLDEIDKIPGGGEAESALLEVLDPTQNDRFIDYYVGVPFDLSEVFFVATANVLDRIPSPLRNRLEVIDLAGYSKAEKFEIAKRLVPVRVEDHGLTSDLIEFEDEALRALISDHADEMGVRDLDRSVSAICRWAALRLETAVGRTAAKVTVKEGMLNEVLGTRSGHGEGLLGVERLRAMIERGGMPPETRRQAKRELQLMLSKPPDDHDYGKILTYLQWLVGLPWSGDEVEAIDVKCAQRVLDERHFGLPEAKKRILEYLAVRRRKRDARGPILCLAGPPGVGKTSLARNIAEAIGRKFGVISCAGLRDGSEVRGHSRTYIGSQPGRIVRELVRIGAKNPVLMLDEIDKIPGGGEAESALLEVLDPTQNDRFIDLYVGVPFDLSEVFFVATANVLDRIPSPLRNRLEVIDLAGYSKAEKFEIAKRLVPVRVEDHGLTSDLIEFEDEALRALISDHADEMGVRDLDRSVSAICRWAALRLETAVGRTAAKVTVKEGMLNEVLGTRSGHGEGLLGVERLRAMIERGGMPPEARRQAKHELQLMLSKSPGDSDYGERLTYLQWLAGLPWSGGEVEAIDVKCVQKVLDEQHCGLAKAKKRILEYLAARKLGGGSKGAIVCFVGPPGVGKTSLARNIAEAIGRKFGVISCAGLRDGSELRGHNRAYRGAQPGRIVRELVRIGAKNPVLMLDEIDKISGEPESALLEVLDPIQNDRFFDHYVAMPFDLSEVFFVATANVQAMIAVPLQDRLEVIELPGYSEDEKFEIARAHLVGRQLDENGLTATQALFTDGALHALIRDYTREAGVRGLERQIGAVCRKVALRRVEGNESPVEITELTVADMLGARPPAEVLSERMRHPGVAMGLAVTPTGGEVLFVEARRMRGGGQLTLTGHLGDVMKESAHAALAWLRVNAASYGVDPGFYETAEVHLHVPAGGIPKDGPSAGVAIVAALVSELTGRTVRHDRAMTGEITLSGDVLAVGGVKEKVLAARRLGIAEVILPKRKEVDENLGEDLLRGIRVRYVSTIDEALELALSSVQEENR